MELVKPPFTIKCTPRFLSIDRFIKKAQFESNSRISQEGESGIVSKYPAISFKDIYSVVETFLFTCDLQYRRDIKLHTNLLPFVVAAVLSDNTTSSPDIDTYVDVFRKTHLSRKEDKEKLLNNLTCVGETEQVTVYRTPFYPEKIQFKELVRLVQRELIKIDQLIVGNPNPNISYKATYWFVAGVKGEDVSPLVNSLVDCEIDLEETPISIQTAKVLTYVCVLRHIRDRASGFSAAGTKVHCAFLNEKDFMLVFKKYPNIIKANGINMEELISKKSIVMVNNM